MPELVVDMATLTGAQMIATGKHHAAIFANDEATERAAVAAGRRTGDPRAPAAVRASSHRAEFARRSPTAELGQVARERAGVVRGQLHRREPPPRLSRRVGARRRWPAVLDERATGFGVALVLGLLEVEGFGA